MRNMIDLIPYLPEAAEQKVCSRREQRIETFAAALESIVTLGIGVGFFVALAAFLSVI
ncbi:MAG: hypothetical protein IJG45_02190 [Oscillospiraceae bacterium]|nr:hypothetical protein [Oscillospiraceae bacterium]